jgi:2-dehydropantoate 2-reductase
MQYNNKDIYIIGNGVIAKALAVALTINKRKVIILRGSTEDQLSYYENIEVEIGQEVIRAKVQIDSLAHYDTLDGLILLTNKSFGNKALADKLKVKAQNTPVVFLQNGLHIENSFIENGFKELYRCVLMATSESLSSNKVRFKLVAPSPIGIIKGSVDVLQEVLDAVHTDVFSFRADNDIQTVVWKKVISNCVFNSVCPLLETDNGIFQRSEEALQIAKTIISECLIVANAYGIDLTMEVVLQNILAISKMSDGQKISTYQDILNKRETEIDTLNLAVANAAISKGLPELSVNSTLGNMVKIKAELSRNS